ncbi:MAG: hypothetical protein AAB483_01845 [Patescibacteria group bacterium]
MKALGFSKLKAKLAAQAQRDKELREIIAGLVDISQLKEISRSPRAIVLVAANKVFAQELFFKKEALQRMFSCEVVIK